MFTDGLSRRFDCLAAMRAMGEPLRFELVRCLFRGSRSVGELCGETGMEVYNVSKHLRILKEAGLVEVEKQGQQRIYRLSSVIECKINPGDETMDWGCCRFSMDRVSGEGGQ